MAQLSKTVNQWLQPSAARTQYEKFAKEIVQRYTRTDAVGKLVQMFEEGYQRKTDDFRTERTLFPSIFCRRYEPDTGNATSCVYRLGMDKYDHLETALAEVLLELHAPAEVDAVFKHFQRGSSTSISETFRAGNGFLDSDAETNLAG